MKGVKARAWDKKNKVMIPWDVLKFKTWSDEYEVNNYEYLDCTAFADRNGNLIYEGDIVEEPYFSNVNPNDRDDNDYLDDTPRNYVVCYDNKQAKFKSVPIDLYKANAGNGGWTGYELRSERLTVIGDIYTNPELLK